MLQAKNKPTTRSSSSKAYRLGLLQSRARDFVIDDFLTFTVNAWRKDSSELLKVISQQFHHDLLIVRSSAVGEDDQGGRLAGALRSESGIPSDNAKAVRAAIDKVLSSFAKAGRHTLPSDRVIVQLLVTAVRACGVVLTWDAYQDRPYYVLNYESGTGKTNQVTSGQKSDTIRILRNLPPNQIPPHWRKLLRCVNQIERLFPDEVLDIEFAIDNEDAVHIFQVRGLSTLDRNKKRRRTFCAHRTLDAIRQEVEVHFHTQHDGPGARTILSDMADWNPAEMLGPRPPPLDSSLYRFLITRSAWNIGRVSLGYTDVHPAELMVCLGDKPYIDTQVSLHSLTPASIPISLRRKLICYGITKLASHPELLDKVEFEAAFSCVDFRLEKRLTELRASGFSTRDVSLLRGSLRTFTNALLASSKRIIDTDMRLVNQLGSSPLLHAHPGNSLLEHLSCAHTLLSACRDNAIPIFSRLARLAFVGLAFLRSLRLERIISAPYHGAVFASLHTVATELQIAAIQVSQRKRALPSFLDQFGHLRPMTYDITSPRYDQMPRAFWLRRNHLTQHLSKQDALTNSRVLGDIDAALRALKLDFSGAELLRFIKTAVEAREYAKYVFTKYVSAALEQIALSGTAVQLDRTEMAWVPVEDILSTCHNTTINQKGMRNAWRAASRRHKVAREALASTTLPSNIVDTADLFIVKYPRAQPNFVTRKRVEATCVTALRGTRLHPASIHNAVVLLESADPGYDWIFAYRPKGIVTKYGGAGSHMTIRCAAFEIPAAIGCGEHLFEILARSNSIVIDCQRGIVAPLVGCPP